MPKSGVVTFPDLTLAPGSVSTPPFPGYIDAAQDARNRKLGQAGEQAVLEWERLNLRAAGKADLADKIMPGLFP